jgi:hypothetical protein
MISNIKLRNNMLSSANKDVLTTLKYFKSFGISTCFVVPTPTGLDKSIMDATKEISQYLKIENIHDYEDQLQGTVNKVLIPTILVSENLEHQTSTSLYRPETKTGDPRLWIYDLKNKANPHDLIALISSNGGLVAINCSNTDLDKLSKTSLFQSLINNHDISGSISEELLEKVKQISSMGFVTTLRPGDTGVGYTFETLMKIPANSSKAPDYKGIELKTKRSGRSGNRTTMFSKTPDWNKSRLRSSKEILIARGRYSEEKKRLQLFHQIDALKPNSYGLMLTLDNVNEVLEQRYVTEEKNIIDVIWELETLNTILQEKHKETFWISAQVRGKAKSQDEQFWYNHVKHTGNIDPIALPTLIELGVVSVDYLIKETPTGGAKDQGYLFKISTSDLDLLFDQVKEYDFKEYLHG